MLQRAIYLGLTVVWLGVGLLLLFQRSLFPNWEPTEAQTNRMQWMYAMAFLFAGWNALRFFLYRVFRPNPYNRFAARRTLSDPPLGRTADAEKSPPA